MKMWEIMVPAYDNNGRVYNIEHHHVWDKFVMSRVGGLSILHKQRGKWSSDGMEYLDRMIPVRIACYREQLKEIMFFTAKHYQQKAVLVSLVYDEVIIMDEKEIAFMEKREKQ